jgi:hypothetical protein
LYFFYLLQFEETHEDAHRERGRGEKRRGHLNYPNFFQKLVIKWQ